VLAQVLVPEGVLMLLLQLELALELDLLLQTAMVWLREAIVSSRTLLHKGLVSFLVPARVASCRKEESSCKDLVSSVLVEL